MSFHRLVLVCAAMFLALPGQHTLCAAEMREALPAAVLPATSALSVAVSRADVALCKSIIFPPHLKGNFGETVAGKFVLDRHLAASGNWRPITPRFGSQGIDQIYIKYDTLGRPRRIMVGEVKYGSAKLGMTRDGLQMSQRWIKPRLLGLSARFFSAANAADVLAQPRPAGLVSARHEIPVKLVNGRTVVFWRENGNRAWKFDGSIEDLATARKQTAATARFLAAAGQDRVSVGKRLIHVQLDGKFLNVTIKDVENIVVSRDIAGARTTGQLRVKLQGAEGNLARGVAPEQIARQIRAKYPHFSDSEARVYANQIAKGAKEIEQAFVKGPSVSQAIAINSLKAGAVGALFALSIEGVSQAWRGEFDPERLAQTGGIGFVSVGLGAAAGQGTQILLMQNRACHAVLAEAASRIGLATNALGNLSGLAVGGGVASVIFAYGGYFLGWYDSGTANRFAVAGVLGSLGGAAIGAGTMAAVTAFGTAGTGAAISSLSGAAATNATLAWLGGGTAAAGGGGMAAGTVVLATGVGVVVIAVTAATMYGFHLYDQGQENKRLSLFFTELLSGKVLANAALREFPPPVIRASLNP